MIGKGMGRSWLLVAVAAIVAVGSAVAQVRVQNMPPDGGGACSNTDCLGAENCEKLNGHKCYLLNGGCAVFRCS